MLASNPQDGLQLVEAFQQPGTQTLVWIWDVNACGVRRLVQHGNKLRLALPPNGARINLCIYNGDTRTLGYVVYAEGHNLCDGVRDEPSNCDPRRITALHGRQMTVIDGFRSTTGQAVRPLMVMPSGSGYTVGENSGDNSDAGTIRVFERPPVSDYTGIREATRPSPAPPQPWLVHGYHGPSGEPLKEMSYPTRSGEIPRSGQLGVAAGAAEPGSYAVNNAAFRPHTLLVADLQLCLYTDFAGVSPDQWIWRPARQDWYVNWPPRGGADLMPGLPAAPAPGRSWP